MIGVVWNLAAFCDSNVESNFQLVMIGALLQEGKQGWCSADTAYQNHFLADNDSVLVDAHV